MSVPSTLSLALERQDKDCAAFWKRPDLLLHRGAGNDGGYARLAHVIKTLAECPAFLAIDNWHGYKSAFNGDDALMLQDRLGVCTDLSPKDVSQIEHLMQKPFFAQGPQKHGRAMTASVMADSIEEGKRLYDTWRTYFEKTAGVH